MIKLTDKLSIGNSDDANTLESEEQEIEALLNVAQDLKTGAGWPWFKYAHIGLVDGPGNTIIAYTAAILALHSLLTQYKVMVYCHSGSRSIVVSAMYLHLTGWFGLSPKTPTIMFDRFSVPSTLNDRIKFMLESADEEVPEIHEAHSKAFDIMPWRQIIKIIDQRE